MRTTWVLNREWLFEHVNDVYSMVSINLLKDFRTWKASNLEIICNYSNLILKKKSFAPNNNRRSVLGKFFVYKFLVLNTSDARESFNLYRKVIDLIKLLSNFP